MSNERDDVISEVVVTIVSVNNTPEGFIYPTSKVFRFEIENVKEFEKFLNSYEGFLEGGVMKNE